MPDVVSPEVRSRMMSGIRGQDTKPELALRKALHGRGLRYKLHDGSLPGRPDLVFPRYSAVVMVNGCFWHAHAGCRYFKLPATRPDFWQSKLLGNRKRDERNRRLLAETGWRVAVVWECAVRDPSLRSTVDVVDDWVRSDELHLEVDGFGLEASGPTGA